MLVCDGCVVTRGAILRPNVVYPPNVVRYASDLAFFRLSARQSSHLIVGWGRCCGRVESRNQKYRLVTFLPIVLFEQFKYFFNLYFLLVALSQFIPALQVGMLPAVAAFILLLSYHCNYQHHMLLFPPPRTATSWMSCIVAHPGFVV